MDEKATDMVKATAKWDHVIEDMEETAAEYRNEGWETLLLHPGDVTPLSGEEGAGLDVLVPDNELEEVEEHVENSGNEFEKYRVFKSVENDIVFLLVVECNPRSGVAVFIPSYYNPETASELIDRTRNRGTFPIQLRNLSEDSSVTFDHDDPEQFAPDA